MARAAARPARPAQCQRGAGGQHAEFDRGRRSRLAEGAVRPGALQVTGAAPDHLGAAARRRPGGLRCRRGQPRGGPEECRGQSAAGHGVFRRRPRGGRPPGRRGRARRQRPAAAGLRRPDGAGQRRRGPAGRGSRRPGAARADPDGAAPDRYRLGHRQPQGDRDRGGHPGRSRRIHGSMPTPTGNSTATSRASAPRPGRASPCCRRTTPPGTSPRSSSGCRFGSPSITRTRRIRSGPACRSK